MAQYEYKVRRVGGLQDQTFQDKLNEWAQQGLRPIFFWPQESGAMATLVDILVVLERQKVDSYPSLEEAAKRSYNVGGF